MISVELGTKIKEFTFNISEVSFEALKGSNPSYTIAKNGDVMISNSKTDYVVLSGEFNWAKLAKGDYVGGIEKLDAISVTHNGTVAYTASHLGMTGENVATGSTFKAYLADQTYSLKGNVFNNELVGGGHNDAIKAGAGNDIVSGMDGNDRLFGEDGRDHLIGGLGSDRLYGGTGADVFEFSAGDGADVILDFQASGKGRDHIDLSNHSAVSSFADLEITRVGSSVLVEFGDDSVLLKHTTISQIDASDFFF